MKFDPNLVKKITPSDQYFSFYHYFQVPGSETLAGLYWVLHGIYGIYLVYDQPGGYEMVKSVLQVIFCHILINSKTNWGLYRKTR